MRNKGFISVWVVCHLCMGCLSRANLIMFRAFLKFLVNTEFIYRLNSGISRAVHHCPALAMRRLDSSLRSHRACRSQCRHAYSGLNKTLFASVGPNSHGRGHLQNTISVAADGLLTEKDNFLLGRMKASRGHQLDGTFISRSFSLISAKLSNVANIPPHIVSIGSRLNSALMSIFYHLGSRLSVLEPSGEKCGCIPSALNRIVRSCGLLFASFFGFCLVGGIKMVGFFTSLIKSSISEHGVKSSQKSSSHGHIGLGFSDFFDKSLSDRFLPGIGFAKCDSGLAQCPSERNRSCFCNSSGLRSSGRFFVVRSKSGPELQCIGIGKPVEWTDFSSDDTGPDFVNTRNAFEHDDSGREFSTSVCEDDFSSERFSLSFDEGNDFNEVCKRFPLDILEQMPVGKEPLLSGGSIEFWSANICGMENRFHTVLGSAKSSAELSPVSAEFSQLHERFVGDEAKWTVSSEKSDGNIEGIVFVGFSSFTSSLRQFSSVCNIDSFDTASVSIDKPFDETDSFDSHPAGLWKCVEPVFDFGDTLGIDSQRTDDVFAGIDGSESNGCLMQVYTDERGEFDASYIPAFGDGLVLIYSNVFHNSFLKKEVLK